MDIRQFTASGPDPVLAFLGWLPSLCLFVTGSGCVSSPPSTVQIQARRPLPTHDDNTLGIPATLGVTTWNVWGLPSWITGASARRYSTMAHVLADLESDVVLLQEVWTLPCFDALSAQTKAPVRNWWTAAARRKDGWLGQNGLLTLSRYPIEGGEIRYFSTAVLPDAVMYKGALKTTISIRPGQRVNIWNVHLQAGPSVRTRSRQIAELVRWVREADDGQIADIVGGDFNCTPETREFQQLAAAIGPSVHQLAQADPLPTWDACKPSHRAGEALDHIFVRMRSSTEALCARPQRLFAASRAKDRLSDHMGVQACLAFRGLAEDEPAIPLLRAVASPPRRAAVVTNP